MVKAHVLTHSLALLVIFSRNVFVTAARTLAWQEGIKHFIWLVMENRSHDNLMGGMTYTDDIDGVLKKPICYPFNVTDVTNNQCAFPQPHDHNSVLQDPPHGSSDSFFEIFGTFHEDLEAIHTNKMKPNMQGYLTMQRLSHGNESVTAASDAINYYLPEDIPTITALASNFLYFDRWFSCLPGPTNPNRACLTSGTAHGHGANDADFGRFNITQTSIFQVFSEHNLTWANYGAGSSGDAAYYNWTNATGHIHTNFFTTNEFFVHLQNNNLSTLTYLNPTCCGVGTESMHPSGLVSDGEAYLKRIYDAIRASDLWEEIMWIITFDESGGFGDHVTPPMAPRPDNLTYTERARDGSTYTMDYSFTGARVPAFVISPWVPKGHVEHKGTNNGEEYTATSILKFLDNFFGLPDLTPRVTWSSTWEHLMLDSPRQDAPMTLPDPIVFVEG